ncbi:MAG: acyl-CoA dehydrogenase family protein [Bryobacterales bacterium]
MSTTISGTTAARPTLLGGGFLLGEVSPEEAFTPEDFSEEQQQIYATADQFMTNEVVPTIAEQEEKKPGVARKLMEKAGELGLLATLVPEKFGGLELDLTTQMIVAERIGRYASFSTTYGAHSGIGTMPLVYFGTEDQKTRYLPKLVSAEWIAAYCLSEPQAGSDALAARTRAELSPDGKHYVLNGEKMWISNGGWADLYTVFAKIDGEKFTAFLIERTMNGVRPGAEEHKMGIRGSSTTPLALDNVNVPVENVLGEIGRGHIIAFNILNLGRVKLGAACVGGCKEILATTIRYANQRKAFGQSIGEFGLIQHKLAEMAIRLYATESLAYRTSGLIDRRRGSLSWEDPEAAHKALAAVEEYAIECSITKVYSSEALDYIVDEGVQIHGGYGFHQDYAVERAYRDARINRIFEGTNEINRLLTMGMLLKRAAKNRLPLMAAVEAAAKTVSGASLEKPQDGPFANEKHLLYRAKQATLFCAGVAYQRFQSELDQQQEVSAAVSDMVMAIFAAESALLRAEKLIERGRGEAARQMTVVLVQDAIGQIERQATTALAACGDGSALDQQLAAVRRTLRHTPLNTIALRRAIAGRLRTAEKYVV